jgi:hypothetical protein
MRLHEGQWHNGCVVVADEVDDEDEDDEKEEEETNRIP